MHEHAPSPSPPTVRAMGRLALPLGTRLVAGSLGAEKVVRWPRVSGVLSPLFPILNQDDVALLDLHLVRDSNPGVTLARVVRELGQLGVAAIVVEGVADEAARREAERSNLPLFLLPPQSDVQRVSRAIARLLSDAEAQEEAQAAALFRQLSQLVAEGAGLDGVATALHRLTGHTVRVRDLEGVELARAGEPQRDSRELSRPLFVQGEPAAILALSDLPEALDRFSQGALEQGAAALTLELVKREAVDAAREGVQGDLLSALRLGEEDALLHARARAAEYPLEGTHWVLVAVADGERVDEEEMRGWLRRVAAEGEARGWQLRSALLRESLPAQGSVADALPWQATVLVGGGTTPWEAGRVAFLHFLHTTWAAPAALTIAAGEPTRGLEGLRRGLAEARDTLSLGLRLFGEGGAYLHREMGLYRLLRHLQGTDDLAHFLERTLAALLAYDAEHDTALLPTLRALLEEGGNVSATAKTLHLHRNSLVYRLDRIRTISGLDPTAPDDAFTLRLALMLHPLR